MQLNAPFNANFISCCGFATVIVSVEICFFLHDGYSPSCIDTSSCYPAYSCPGYTDLIVHTLTAIGLVVLLHPHNPLHHYDCFFLSTSACFITLFSVCRDIFLSCSILLSPLPSDLNHHPAAPRTQDHSSPSPQTSSTTPQTPSAARPRPLR